MRCHLEAVFACNRKDVTVQRPAARSPRPARARAGNSGPLPSPLSTHVVSSVSTAPRLCSARPGPARHGSAAQWLRGAHPMWTQRAAIAARRRRRAAQTSWQPLGDPLFENELAAHEKKSRLIKAQPFKRIKTVSHAGFGAQSRPRSVKYDN